MNILLGTRRKAVVVIQQQNRRQTCELSLIVLWKANLDLVSDQVGYLAEELGKQSGVGMS